MWALKYAFYQYGGYGTVTPRFVGLENFARVFRDDVYWESLVRTFTYGFGKLLIILPLAFFLAFLLNTHKKGHGAVQSIIFLPTIMSSAVMGLVFYLLFNAYNGEINKYLMEAHIISQPINWLGKEHAMKTLLTAVWGGLGNYMVYFIAGIQQVSKDAIESARIDGASRLQTIWYIIIPMLGPILKIILMLAITFLIPNDITNVMVLTEGGPNNAKWWLLFTATAISSRFLQLGRSSSIWIWCCIKYYDCLRCRACYGHLPEVFQETGRYYIKEETKTWH